ncbi:galactokinase [Actinocrinis puniceicyclus]|uniref:Galactokinase n=1 Tax=Actinocrinis puniceicyclus TaxID=977794 RepID=A0A8J7WN59_9ACTN|nr:galactokinase [Actinocrinis puniceicyclus]MBS2963207.1 galactokinase [Actinocrinis puniceicyclus]
MNAVDPIAAEAANLFASVYGGSPEGVWAAPGRVNVIGEHTDYNEGFVLPMAIDRYTVAAAARRTDGRLRVVSAAGDHQVAEVALADLSPGVPQGWPQYPAGVAWALRGGGVLPDDFAGADLAFASTVPVGAGLSSSAALECATGLALAGLAGARLSTADLARLSQYAENEYAHVPCGPLDQLASAFGQEGRVLFIDTRSFQITAHPFDLAGAGLTLLVADTRVSHDLGESGYPARRASCEKAAAALGVRALRDLAPADLDRAAAQLDEVTARRVRHVVTEDARVEQFVSLLTQGAPAGDRLRAAGELLTASHRSLRDDFEVSCAELDLVVDAALEAGAHGARMTGGGFGGSAIALVSVGDARRVGERVLAALPQAEIFRAIPARGAHRVG